MVAREQIPDFSVSEGGFRSRTLAALSYSSAVRKFAFNTQDKTAFRVDRWVQ
jgi:hypothetical protein